MSILIANARLLDDHFQWRPADLLIEAGRIAAISGGPGIVPPRAEPAASRLATTGEQAIDAAGKRVLPGLVDLHVHGAYGADMMQGTPDALATISRYLASQGVTSFLATSVTAPAADLAHVLDAESVCVQPDGPAGAGIDQASLLPGARLLGFHLEGPFINKISKGAQDAAAIRPPDLDEFCRYPAVRKVTLAPEIDGAMAFIQAVAASGHTVVSLGHTTADYSTGEQAFQQGARCLTHLFNAMPPLLHRAPGVIGAALTAGAYTELIADGVHVHPALILAAYRLFGPERLLLVSDSVMAAGMPDGAYRLGGQPITMSQGICRTAEGALAGGTTSLWQCVRIAVRSGITWTDAIRMATETPATLIGWQNRIGCLKAGMAADLVIVDDEDNIERTIVAGRTVFSR